MANILLPTQQLRLQEGYAKDTNVGVTNASIASRFATIQPVRSNTHIPFMINPADQMNYAKRAVDIVEKYQETQRAREKEVVFNNAVNDYTQKLNDITNAFKDERGKNAIDNYDKYKTKIDNLNKEYGDVFTKHADLQQQFTVATSKLNSRATLELDNWKSNETIKAKADTLNLNVTNKGNTYLYNIGSPAEKKYREDYFNSFLEYAKYMGWSGDIATAEWTKRFTEDAYSYADYACDIKNFGGALSFIQRNKNDLDPSAYYKILGRIRRAQEADRASRAGYKSSVAKYNAQERAVIFQQEQEKAIATAAKAKGLSVQDFAKQYPTEYNTAILNGKLSANQLVYNHDKGVEKFQDENNMLQEGIKDVFTSKVLPMLNKNGNYTLPDNNDYVGQLLKYADNIQDENLKQSFKTSIQLLMKNNPDKANEIVKGMYCSVFTPNVGAGAYLKLKSKDELLAMFPKNRDLALYGRQYNISTEDMQAIGKVYAKAVEEKNNGTLYKSNPIWKSIRDRVLMIATNTSSLSKAEKAVKDDKFSLRLPIILNKINQIYDEIPRNPDGSINNDSATVYITNALQYVTVDDFATTEKAYSVVDDVVDDFDFDSSEDMEKKGRQVLTNIQMEHYTKTGRYLTKDELSNKLESLQTKMNLYGVDLRSALTHFDEYDASEDNSNGEVNKKSGLALSSDITGRIILAEDNILSDVGKNNTADHIAELQFINEKIKDLSKVSPLVYENFIKKLKEEVKKSKIDSNYKDVLLKDL